MFNFLRPKAELTDADRARNSTIMMRQIFASSGADGFVSGGFLAAFALLIGASNLHIGIMTAIPFIMQPLQLFSVVLIERLRVRKPLALVAYLINFAAWVPIALMPFVLEVPSAGAVALLLGFIAIRGGANALFVSSWNSWLRDLVPTGSAGDYFAQRLRIATIAAVITGLAAAVFADWWKGFSTPDNAVFGYSIAFLFGSIVLGFSAVGLLSRVIEPRMPPPSSATGSLVSSLVGPIRDENFRKLVNFLFVWNFVVYLATPFFAVYMITRLDFPLTLVVGLGVVSQVMNILFLRVWGNMVDVFSGKSHLVNLLLVVFLGDHRVDFFDFARSPRGHDTAVDRAPRFARHGDRWSEHIHRDAANEAVARPASDLVPRGRIAGRQHRSRNQSIDRRILRGLFRDTQLQNLRRMDRSQPHH